LWPPTVVNPQAGLAGYTGWPQKRKPLQNYEKIVSTRIKVCQWD